MKLSELDLNPEEWDVATSKLTNEVLGLNSNLLECLGDGEYTILRKIKQPEKASCTCKGREADAKSNEAIAADISDSASCWQFALEMILDEVDRKIAEAIIKDIK